MGLRSELGQLRRRHQELLFGQKTAPGTTLWAEDGTRNCTFRLWQQESETGGDGEWQHQELYHWQQESETGGDDGLEKRT